MGRRARKGGIANAALRRARAGRDAKNAEARDIAQRVYHAATQLEAEVPGDDRPLPLRVLAPVTVAAENVMPGVLALHGLPTGDEEYALDVAAYLVYVWRDIVWGFDREHFERWRQEQDDAARLPSSE